MKGVFLALVLANVLTFAWTQWHSSEARPTAAPATPVPTLQLASEAQRSTTSQSPTSDAGTAVAADEQPAAEPDVPADSNTTVAAVSPQADGGDPISDVARCVSIGAFRDLAEATQASATLREAGYEPRTRVAEGDIWAGLWVYLDDLPSRDEAQRAMTLLKRRGISDAYIMPSADQTNDISLGVFSEPARAQRRAEEIRALGFTPTIADRTRRGPVYWIDINLKSTDGVINPADLQSESGRIVRLEVLACPVADADVSG
jgi:cell division septation protein DedD